MERRFISAAACPVKLQQRGEGQTPRIEGYGATYYDGTPATEYVLWDFASERAVERILPGAFSKSITDDVRGLFNHDANQVLGRTASKTMTLTSDNRGLLYSIEPGDTTIARDVQQHLKRGDVTGSSFAFNVNEERWTETKTGDKWFVVREIISVSPLYDVGPVTFPAYTSTSAGVRSADSQDAKTAYEKHKSTRDDAAAKLAATLNRYATRARLVAITE
jgi:HK97 family phage prohead protease